MKKILLIILLSLFIAETAFASWTVDSIVFEYRKKVTTQFANVDGTITNFPLYVDVTGDTDIGGRVQSDGDDLRFTSSDGSTVIHYEIDTFAVAAGSATGDLWVQVPSVSSSAGTDIYCYYGDAGASAYGSPSSTWDSEYLYVLHMNDATTSTVVDSTSNGYTFDKLSATNPNTTTDSIIGNAQNFDDDSDDMDESTVDLTGLTDGGVGYSLNLWLEADAYTGTDRWITYAADKMLWRNETTSQKGYMHDGTNLASTSRSGLGTGAWHNVTFFWQEASDDNHVISYDLNLSGGNTDTTIYGFDSTETVRFSSSGSENFNGRFDEARASGKDRGGTYRKFVYYNIKNADNEIDWGSEEYSAIPVTRRVITISRLVGQ